MMESLMNNPYAWGILSLCTIGSLIFAIYTWIVGRRTKEISVDFYTNDIIKQGKTPISKLKIEFDGRTIRDLSSTIFYIWNSGNDVISGGDIVNTRLLKIGCDSENILDAQIIKQSEEGNSFSISNFSSNDITFTFDYLDSGDGVKIQVLHTSSSDELFVDCKIKGGKEIRDCQKLRKDKGIKGFLKGCIDELFPMLILIIGFYLSVIILNIVGIPYKENSFLVTIISVINVLFIIVLYLKIKEKIKIAFHRTIPDKLRK